MTSLIECRNQKVGIHDPRGAVWCQRCIHYTLIDITGLCECCKFKVAQRTKNVPDITAFEKIAMANSAVLSAYKTDGVPDSLSFYWPIQLGIIRYLVPVKYLAEFMELTDINNMRKFVESVKKECKVLPRYIPAVK